MYLVLSGSFSKASSKILASLAYFSSIEEVLKYFQALYLYVEQYRSQLPQDTYVQNQVDTIVELINSTIYKLKFLK